MTTYSTRRAQALGRSSLFWTIGLLAASHAVLALWIHRAHPDLCDPTWDFRIERLHARMAEAPGRPLLLFLGSSRPANGICPQAMGEWAPISPSPLVFNFATLGGGPVRELLTLRRLLGHGIKPKWVIAELWPLFWAEKGRYNESQPVLAADYHLSDLPVLGHLYHNQASAISKVACETFTPLIHYRGHLLGHYASFLMSRDTQQQQQWEMVHWATLDEWGWLPVAWARKGPAEFAKDLEVARQDTLYSLEDVRPREHVDWCVRQLIQTCRQEGIQLYYFLMPEPSAMRGWFPPRVQAFYHEYLRGLQKDQGLEVIDTRDWLSDDAFVDFCHLLPRGAKAYSARLAQEVLRPLLAGAPLPVQAHLRPPEVIPPAESATSAPGS